MENQVCTASCANDLCDLPGSFCIKMFEGLTAVTVNIAVFWDVTVCNLVAIYRYFGGLCFFHVLLLEDEDSMFLQKAGRHPPDYMASHPRNPRRQLSL